MPGFSQVSKQRLATCDARLRAVLEETIKEIDFIVLEGHRGQADQDKAFAEGKSKLKFPKGKHNALPSRAVDIWPYPPDGTLNWKDVVAAGRLMGYIQRVAKEMGIRLRFGLDWDGDFRTAGPTDPDESFLDAPHVEILGP
jgi:peptidoglycan L-alanyl-D-glutamate endopeptidase CwlK